MTEGEWSRIYEMSQDRNLYQNLINSLFPTIHGECVSNLLMAIVRCIVRHLFVDGGR